MSEQEVPGPFILRKTNSWWQGVWGGVGVTDSRSHSPSGLNFPLFSLLLYLTAGDCHSLAVVQHRDTYSQAPACLSVTLPTLERS